MVAVHFTTIPCEPNLSRLAYGKIWLNGSRSYTNSIALVEFEWLKFAFVFLYALLGLVHTLT